LLSAGTTGKISGKLTDEKTGEAIVGASVVIVGTNTGAPTDVEGVYVISNLSPGTYSVAFTAVGYRKKLVKNVQVNIDLTTRIDQKLSSEEVNLEAVEVVAQRPMVRTDLTSSQSVVDAQEIKALPVESVTGILSTQAGIIVGSDGALHFRGGRSNEVAYTINGMAVNNPFNNSANFNIATNAIQELSVVQGTFNAEYGNALSGVVEQGLKEGGSKYTGQISFYTGDRLSNHSDIFLHIDDFDPLSHSVTEGTFGGPIPGAEDMLSFFISARYDKDKGWLYGKREHTPWDSSAFGATWYAPMNGDGAWVPMNHSESWTSTTHIAFKPTPMRKISYDFVFNQDRSGEYSQSYRYDPDGYYQDYSNDVFHALEYSDWISTGTSFKVKVSYSRDIGETYRYQDLDSIHYVPSERSLLPVNTGFLFGGAVSGQYANVAQTMAWKFDMTSQISSRQEIKAGLEARLPKLHLNNFTVERDLISVLYPTVPAATDSRVSYYDRAPVQYSAYLQDKLEYESIVMNLGLRYDYFLANSKYIVDFYNPTGEKALASAKTTVSPRLGVSYPVTDRGIIHFSYGHFCQMPNLSSLYTNPDFKSPSGGNATYGNANLKPQKTVTYEVGLQQQLSDNLAFNVTGFYKDVRDLFAVQTIRISESNEINMYVNKDYGNIKGITFSLTKRRLGSDLLSLSLDYTYQVAEGNDVASASAFFIDQSSGRESERVVVYLGWDQTHTLNTTLALGQPGDWNASFIMKMGSGLPYTPLVSGSQVLLKSNTGRKPMEITVDLLAQKEFEFEGLTLALFLKVFNLFDTLNEVDVYSSTGTASPTKYDTDAGQVYDQHIGVTPGVHSYEEYLKNPGLYSSPREVRVGCSLSF
jgi:outer membrane receptor protein involved in Fe transport